MVVDERTAGCGGGEDTAVEEAGAHQREEHDRNADE